MYRSEEGSYCDSYSYKDISPDSTYVLAITTKNITGLPLTLCVSNPVSRRCNTSITMPKDHTARTTYYLIPPKINGNAIDININNFAVRKTPSVNELYEIKLIPFPAQWLATISTTKEPIKTQYVVVNATKKITPLSYGATLPKTNKETLILLPFTFETGWKAYITENNIVTKTFPFFFGKEIKDHVIVNNWENGWILPNTSSEQNDTQTIILVFLPQYLQYVGFAFLLGTFGVLCAYLFIQKMEAKKSSFRG